jgi:choline monooxygenase
MNDSDFPEGERGVFDPDALVSHTLPSRYYHDAQLYRQELRAIFHKSWCYVGHAAQLPATGDYRVERIADQCIFLLRDRNSEIRAYHNVCQHRGHELLNGEGNCKNRIVCPYHAWCYGLDGKLIQAPQTAQLRNFDAGEYGLKPVRLASCAGLLFANLDGGATDFDIEYPGLAQTIDESLPGVESFVTDTRFDFDIAANWKIVVDNFSEGYHIPVAHRRLSQVLESGSGSRARQERRYAFFESRSKAGYEGLELEPGSPYRSWTIWPNTCMLSLPGCANLVVIRMAADGPERCLERVDLLAEPNAEASVLKALKSLFADQFNAEDIAIVESVHRGLKSLGYDQGRYVVDEADGWYSESGLHRFHQQVLQALAAV